VGKQTYTNAKLWYGGYDLSSDHSEVALTNGVELETEPAFGDGVKTVYAGLRVADFGAAGHLNTALSEPQLFANVSGILPITVAPGMPGGLEGEIAYFLQALQSEFNPIAGISVGKMAKFRAAAKAQGSHWVRGTVLRNALAAPGDAASGNGTVFNLGAVPVGQFIYAAAHVIAVVGGTTPTLTLALQSAPTVGFASPTTRYTFPVFNVAGIPGFGWMPPIPGPITDAFWRLVFTITGAPTGFQYAAVAGIAP
jgi:hypothetical protein